MTYEGQHVLLGGKLVSYRVELHWRHARLLRQSKRDERRIGFALDAHTNFHGCAEASLRHGIFCSVHRQLLSAWAEARGVNEALEWLLGLVHLDEILPSTVRDWGLG